jgi:uncharacterized damage-inducible protein DinB
MMPDHGQPDPSVLTVFFTHNTWANLKLLGFCEGLSDEQLDATTIGGFGSIRATLMHIIGAEVGYVERVNGRRPAETFSGDEFPGFKVLKAAARWAGDELLQLALSARSDTMVRQRPPRMLVAYKLASLIPQAITHSTEHRTHISVIITQLGMEPPDMSVWNYLDEIGEIQELGAGAEG